MEKRYLLTESELRELLEDRFKLAALEAAGVDNWEGYEFAQEELDNEDDEYTIEDAFKNYELYY